jgi:hypothetical protein
LRFGAIIPMDYLNRTCKSRTRLKREAPRMKHGEKNGGKILGGSNCSKLMTANIYAYAEDVYLEVQLG